jgi:hypothetical protein
MLIKKPVSPQSSNSFQKESSKATANSTSETSLQTEEIKGAHKIKALPPSVVKDIEQKNVARRLAGLPLIQIKVRHCLICATLFESAGNRTCGCSSRSAGSIAGREII